MPLLLSAVRPPAPGNHSYPVCLCGLAGSVFYIRNHEICGPLCLCSFTERACEVLPRCSVCVSTLFLLVAEYSAVWVYPVSLSTYQLMDVMLYTS